MLCGQGMAGAIAATRGAGGLWLAAKVDVRFAVGAYMRDADVVWVLVWMISSFLLHCGCLPETGWGVMAGSMSVIAGYNT
jgi:hypothetical protein